MVYIVTQDERMSIPINDNMVVYIGKNDDGGGDVVTNLFERKCVLGTYKDWYKAQAILRSINSARAENKSLNLNILESKL